jgi:hypothetical protein
MTQPPPAPSDPALSAPGPAAPRIGAEDSLSAVLSRYPSTAVVFAQHGPLFTAQKGQVYPTFPDLTVEGWARVSGAPLESLLLRLNAQAEGDAAARGGSHPPAGHRSPVAWARTTIGYTGSYDERSDVTIEPMSVVQSQEHGPG